MLGNTYESSLRPITKAPFTQQFLCDNFYVTIIFAENWRVSFWWQIKIVTYRKLSV